MSSLRESRTQHAEIDDIGAHLAEENAEAARPIWQTLTIFERIKCWFFRLSKKPMVEANKFGQGSSCESGRDLRATAQLLDASVPTRSEREQQSR